MRATALVAAAVSRAPLVVRVDHADHRSARPSRFFVLQLSATVAHAARIQVLIGANTTANASQIFQPQSVRAVQGDVVVFNCEYLSPSVPPASHIARGTHLLGCAKTVCTRAAAQCDRGHGPSMLGQRGRPLPMLPSPMTRFCRVAFRAVRKCAPLRRAVFLDTRRAKL